MLNFGKLYDIISDEEKKSIITYLIKEIQIYPHGESEMPLKSIEFNFQIYQRTCADQMQGLRTRDRLLCQWELKAPTDRSRSDCVHEHKRQRLGS